MFDPMAKSKDELLTYGIKMLKRGDPWTAISRYLDRQEVPEKIQKEIIAELSRLEAKGKITVEEPISKPSVVVDILISSALIAGGLIMMMLLWDAGYIASIPFIIIGGGVLGLIRAGLVHQESKSKFIKRK